MIELSQTLEGHTDRVWTTSWNRFGTVLASSGADKTIRLWTQNNTGKWECSSILTQTHNKSIRRLCWSPCGTYLASASFDSTVCISKRNPIDGSWTTVVNLEGHESEVKSIAWSHDGQFLASCGRDRTIWIWERATNIAQLDSEEDEIDDAENWDCSDVKNDHSKDVKHVVWHPNHNILTSTSYDDTVKLFHKDGEDWKCFDTLSAHRSTVWSASFSPSGEYLVTCSDDKTVMIWKNHAHNIMPNVQASSWKLCSVIQGYHTRPIYDVSWCHQTELIASASGDNAIAIYKRDKNGSLDGDFFSCVYKHNQAHKSDVNTVSWNPRHPGLLASASDDRSVKIWKYVDNNKLGTRPNKIIDEILEKLSEAKLDRSVASSSITDSDMDGRGARTDISMTFDINGYTNLSYIIQILQTLQSETYVDSEKQQLMKLLDLKFSSKISPPVRLSGLNFDDVDYSTKMFYVDITDQTDQIKYRFKLIVNNNHEAFKLQLPRRSIKIINAGKELFLIEKTGDLYKILLDGRSEFLLGHLFALSDIQFVPDEQGEKLSFIISADRDEKLRISSYPNTFEIERYCFGHKYPLRRIFIVDTDRFVSIDQQGDICLWNLADLNTDRYKPLTPVRTASISNETLKKRLCMS